MTTAAPAIPALTPSRDTRPGFAILCRELTPYRVHFHRRVVRELPEFRLWTLLARDSAWSAWKLGDLPELNVVGLAEGTVDQMKTRPGHARLQWRIAANTVHWLEAHRPRVLMVAGYDEMSRVRAIRWANRRDVPVLFFGDSNIRCDTVTGWRRLVKRAVVPSILRRCDAVLCCGSLGRAYFRRYGVPDSRIFYSPVEPDYAQLEAVQPAVLDEARRGFGLEAARFRFVVSSRLVSYKRVDVAIDAFGRIASQRPDWDLVILGEGPDRSALQNRVPQGLRSRVKFTGFVGRQEVVTAVYQASHILVHPSAFEPWALVINEAAAARLAIVSSDGVGASAELVRDGVNGSVVPTGDVDAFAAAMLRASDPVRLEQLRTGSSRLLSAWRAQADPIAGVREALSAVGVGP
jgi:glycosyltransferase involved in cell wall biosynthesis